MSVRGRYAPSPTGELHLGNARTALAAWLGARSAGGAFVMRVEDLDPPRIVAGTERRILDDLRWLGLDWDEGPDEGGPFAPYRQSDRGALYRAALERLRESGRLYACSCTRAELRSLSSAPHGPGTEGPPYPGICRDKGLAVEIDPSPGARPLALRFRVEPGEVRFEDAVFGPQRQEVAFEVGDFVVRRSDGLYTYQLAVTVDDGAMEISEVVRGADLLHSTARQIALQEAFGLVRPRYAHVPLVVGPGGERLAKRDRSATLAAIRATGARAEEVVGRMAASLGLLDRPEPVAPRELVSGFSWERVSREPWTHGTGSEMP